MSRPDQAAIDRQRELLRETEIAHMQYLAKKWGFKVVKK